MTQKGRELWLVRLPKQERPPNRGATLKLRRARDLSRAWAGQIST